MAAVFAQYLQVPMASSSFKLQNERTSSDARASQWFHGEFTRDADSDIASSRSQTPEPKRPLSLSNSQEGPFGKDVADDERPSLSFRISSESLLSLSPEELYHAKVLVLDLLGWGVPPEYIIQRGVSLELVCIVFSELKLRLPENIAADYAAVLSARRAS